MSRNLIPLTTLLFCFLMVSCVNNSKKVKLTTPYEDARICSELLNNCSSLKEIDEARGIINRYKSAYNSAVYNGDITAPQLEEFLLNCPNEIEIQNTAAFVAHTGKSINSTDID